jgi:hypothetical protein
MADRLIMSEQNLRRFYNKVVVDLETGCWEWTAAINNHGYGVLSLWGKNRLAHKVAYEHFVGPVPRGLILGHYVQRDTCAFWEHVRPITHSVNMQEAWDATTYCDICKYSNYRCECI